MTLNTNCQQWDLNTGQVVRSFDGHSGQISSIVFRPLSVPSVESNSTVGSENQPSDSTDVDPVLTSPLMHDLENDLAKELDEPVYDAKDAFEVKPAEDDSPMDSGGDAEGEDDGDGDSLFGDQDDSIHDPGSGDVESVDMDADGDQRGPTTNPLEDQVRKVNASDTGSRKVGELGGAAIALPGRKTDALPDTKKPPALSVPSKEEKRLPKPLFGSMTSAWQYDADISQFSNDIFLTSTLSGQVMLWDRRVDTKSKQGVRALELPAGTPPWCTSVCWNHTGDKIYVGRRNETVEEWDVRMLPDATRPDSVDRSHLGRAPKHIRALRMPRGSGPVSSVLVMPNDRHLVWCVSAAETSGSFDNVRLWDTQASESAGVPFKIVAGHHGGTISKMGMYSRIDHSGRSLYSVSLDEFRGPRLVHLQHRDTVDARDQCLVAVF